MRATIRLYIAYKAMKIMDNKVCIFFGHHDCPVSVLPRLRATIIDLIEHKGITMFYVGDHGRFDELVRTELRKLSALYPCISYSVVLAYVPRRPEEGGPDTMLPEEIEFAPRRYAITRRNRWMLKRADCVVAYQTHSWGGAAQFIEAARRGGLEVYNLASDATLQKTSGRG